MEAVEVVAHFDKQGEIWPVSLIWQGRKYQVVSHGRRWRDERGLHILVMVPVERVFELIFVVQDGLWYIKPSGNVLKNV
jgi:hypothetical protein